MSDNIDIYIDSAPIDIVVSGAQGATNTSGGGDLTSGPVTSSNGVSAIANGALTIAMTSGLQSALNGKQATLTDYSTISSLTGYPSSFTPSSHTHPWSQITGEANHVPFNIAPTSVPTTEGTVSWNSDDHTLNITTDVSGVVLQVGQEQHVRVRNTTGSTISNGAAVYLSGASGQRPTVALADADNDTHVASTIGLATADIAHNAFGYVTVGGLVRGVNTTGMTEGGPIYLSGTAGDLTQTAPTSNVVRIGFCVVAGNNGTILVHVEKMSVKSADVLDAVSAWSGSGDTGKVVKYGADGILSPGLIDCATTGAVSITGLSFGNTGVFGSSDNSYGVQGQSSTGTGVQCLTATGTYHALFGADSGNNRSAIERVRGWLVWFYSTYVGRLKTEDITANRDWTLPDATGTIALTSDLTTKLTTDPTGITGAAALTNIISLTQAQYDAIGSKSSTTLYVIT